PFAPRVASAQTYPSRPVRIIVGFAAGGIADITARLIGQWLSSRLGEPFIVENRPGAGGNLATEAVGRARPGGYTLLQTPAANSFSEMLYHNLNFNLVRDIAPVATILRSVGVMEVNPSIPANTGPEFIAYARANPGKISMATAGLGSGPYVFGELFKKMTGLDLLTVNYRGSGAAIPDLIGGQVQVMFDLAVTAVEQIRAGRLRPLGVTTTTRLDALPDVPPIADFVPGYEASAWQGIGAPKNTPVEIIDKLNKEINA